MTKSFESKISYLNCKGTNLVNCQHIKLKTEKERALFHKKVLFHNDLFKWYDFGISIIELCKTTLEGKLKALKLSIIACNPL